MITKCSSFFPSWELSRLGFKSQNPTSGEDGRENASSLRMAGNLLESILTLHPANFPAIRKEIGLVDFLGCP